MSPGLWGVRTINLVIEFSKVCYSIKAMKENVSTRNKQEQVDVVGGGEKTDLCLVLLKPLTGDRSQPLAGHFCLFAGKYTKI